jgi:hypothetical protein
MKQRQRFASRLPVATSALPFEFIAVLPLKDCTIYLKKMTVTNPPSDIAFLMIDADTQRFYLKTRAFQSHLLEVKGLLRRIDGDHTQVSGDIFGDSLITPLLVAFLIGLFVLVVVILNPYVLLLGLLASGIVIMYWRRFAARVTTDKVELAQLIQETLTPSQTTSPKP